MILNMHRSLKGSSIIVYMAAKHNSMYINYSEWHNRTTIIIGCELLQETANLSVITDFDLTRLSYRPT